MRGTERTAASRDRRAPSGSHLAPPSCPLAAMREEGGGMGGGVIGRRGYGRRGDGRRGDG